MGHLGSQRVVINNVMRDLSQAKYANRIPLDHPRVLKVFSLWDSLNENGPPLFGIIEMGGASVQVDENFLGKDYTETARAVRQAAPSTVIRPLWRGANSFLLNLHIWTIYSIY
jgi:pyruvate/oxaloacetate carboxyltransferase